MVRAFPPMAKKEPDTGQRMRAWLHHAGITAREAARRSGVTHATICYILLGERDTTIATLHTLCSKALDCTLAEFFGPLPKERAA